MAINFWVAVVSILLVSTPCLAIDTKNNGILKLIKSESLGSQFTNLKITEFVFSAPIKGGGGAIVIQQNNLIIATTEGQFILLDLNNNLYKVDFLPKLDFGDKNIKKSKQYKYQELTPRLNDIILFDGTYYIQYDDYDEKTDAIRFNVAKYTNSSWRKIYTSPKLNAPYYTLGTGGKLAIKDDLLFVTIGDYSLDRINSLETDVAAQNNSLPWGKVYTISLKTEEAVLYSSGHRNPQGIVVLDNSSILISEHGPRGGDELNFLEKGANYGWPYSSYGTIYGHFGKYLDGIELLSKKPVKFNKEKFQAPLYSFVPSVAPTSLIQIKNFHPDWDGNILMASLRAQQLFHIRILDNRVIFCEPISIKRRIRDLKQSPQHGLWALTDTGTLLKIEREATKTPLFN